MTRRRFVMNAELALLVDRLADVAVAGSAGVRWTALPGPGAACDVALLAALGHVRTTGGRVCVTADGLDFLAHMMRAAS